MKKIISLFLCLMVLFSGLIVINIFKTNDLERIENIDQTSNSFKIYVSDTSETSQDMIQFFQKLSLDKKVSIIRTDFPENKIVKSVIANEETFPYENFFQDNQSFTLFDDNDVTYSSDGKKSADKLIPSLNSEPIIELQTLQKYYENNDKSANGVYNIIPLSSEDKDGLLADLSGFFGTSSEDLQTPKMHSKKEYINKYFLIYLLLFGILSLITLLSVLSIPMTQTKSIGVWKLCGLKTKDVLKQLFLLPYAVSIIASIMFDVFVSIYFSYSPRYLLVTLVATQVFILVLLSFSVLLASSMIRSITVVSLVKNSHKFNLGIGTMFCLKVMMVVFTTVLLIANLANLSEISKANEVYQKADKEGTLLAVEKLGFSNNDTLKNFELNNGKNEENMANFFSDLEENCNAFFFTGSIIKPLQNLQTYNPEQTFNKSNSYEVISVNRNYLKSISLNVPDTSSPNVFLVPDYYKNDEDKIGILCKMLAANRMEDSDTQSLEDIDVTIQYYNEKKSEHSQVFYNNDLVTFYKAIYEVVDSKKLDHISQVQLLTTGVRSPIRVENSQKNRDYISKKLKSKEMSGMVINFSTVSSILGNHTDSSRLALQFSVTLLLIVFSLSLIVSGFICLLYFKSNKMYLSVQRLLGLKLFDRYKGIIFIWFLAYFVQLVIMTIYTKSLLGMAVGIAITILDIFISISVLSYYENKNLVAVLKGE